MPMKCETWTDHEFGAARLAEAGRHPVRGPFTRWEYECGKCHTKISDTRWLDPPREVQGVPRADD